MVMVGAGLLRACCLLWALLLVGPAPVRADDASIHVRSAEITQGPEGLVLAAAFRIELDQILEEALNRGLTLHFVTEFELRYEPWYFLGLLDRVAARFEQEHRLSYNPLTRQYRVTAGGLTRHVDTLSQALGMVARVSDRLAATRDEYRPGESYQAQLRLRLDASQLPKPFQLSSLGSRSWNLSSEWFRWPVTP